MSKEDINTCILKVNLDCCDGCKRRVRETLHKVKGVIKVDIDGDQNKVTVSGINVDPATLIKKLRKISKIAKIWGGSTGNPQTSIQPVSSDKGGGETSKNKGKKVECCGHKDEPEIQTESESDE